jgi:hypothetical protein
VARTKRVMQIHGVSFKLIPFIFLSLIFLFFSPYTNFIELPSLEAMMVALAFIVGGVAFLYEGVYAWPKKGGNQASMVGSIFFWIAGTLSVLFGVYAWLADTNPLTNGEFIEFAQIFLIADMIMLFIGTIFEIVMSHRLSHKMSGKPANKILN